MSAIKIITAFLLTAMLCGCSGEDTDIGSSETLRLTETARTEAAEDTNGNDEKERLDTLFNFGKYRIDLDFSGSREGDEYNGTLSLSSYLPGDGGRRKPLGSCTVYENESFTLNVPEGSEALLDFRTEKYFTLDIPGGIMLFELGSDGQIFPYSYEGGYEIPGIGFGFAPPKFADKYRFYDYGRDSYSEYCADPKDKTVRLEGVLNFSPGPDMTELVKRSDSLMKIYDGHKISRGFEDFFTEMYGDGDVTYYRVSPDIAAAREELAELFEGAFTEDFRESFFHSDPFLSPDSDYPPFLSEDGDGLIYAHYYHGVPVRYDYNTVRAVGSLSGGVTSAAAVLGAGADQSFLTVFYFDLSADECPASDTVSFEAGAYFLEE